MTQRRRPRRPARRARRRFGRRAFLAGLGVSACAAGAFFLRRGTQAAASPPEAPGPAPTAPDPALPAGEWRAVWVSYLEWAELDFSSEEAFRAGAAQLLDNCLSLGLNTVIAQVRPFGDALYRSQLFPWSHLCTGVQGQDPGFDPLDVLLTEAHGRGLSVEAWINPYRLKGSASMPAALAENNLMNTHPEWVWQNPDNGSAYLNPAIPEAADYVVQGVAELVQNYAIDGVHFDDYFYPTTDPALDAARFAASGAGDLGSWRRANVTALVKAAHNAVKAAGSTRFAFENIVPAWCAMPRSGNVALYFGLGAYRVGTGDGGANEDSTSQWSTGSALAKQVESLRAQGAGGWALYRYGSLFGSAAPEQAAAEREALARANA